MTETSLPTNTATVDAAGSTVDVQDPLPENDWTWRRAFTYVVSLILVALILYVLQSLHQLRDAKSLYQIGRLLCYLLALVITFYLTAPSAEQIVHLVQAARTLRAGVPMNRIARAESPDGTTTEVSSTAGQPTPPPAPVAPVPPVAPKPAGPAPTEIME